MKYDLKNKDECTAAFTELTKHVGDAAFVEIKLASDQRTSRQNRYFYALLGVYGLETGFTREEAKTIFKRVVNPEIFVYEKNGMKFLKSSAEIDKSDMKTSIDRFMKHAAELGIELPEAGDTELLRHMEERIKLEGKWL